MIWVKSVLAGLAALIGYVLLLVLFVSILMGRLVSRPASLPGDAGYVSNSPWIPAWLILLGALFVFAVAFYWRFQRISRAARTRR
jgi:hypothetical protein